MSTAHSLASLYLRHIGELCVFLTQKLKCRETAQELACTDGKALSPGVSAENGVRSVADLPVLTRAIPNQKHLEAQLLVPVFGNNLIELGTEVKCLPALKRIAVITECLKRIFRKKTGESACRAFSTRLPVLSVVCCPLVRLTIVINMVVKPGRFHLRQNEASRCFSAKSWSAPTEVLTLPIM